MSTIPEELKYTKEHEWLRMDGDFIAVCGITDHAQEMLTDIVFVELPEKGLDLEKGEQAAVVESVKAVSNIYAPVSGKVIEVNTILEDSPELVNSDPYGEGWIFKLEIKGAAELDDLLNADDYAAHVEAEK
ncbi:MAG: glycine cleavage system protein GcvH [Spirochaetes bacterium]|nr:MAG: glycine cleavage system protein GcvH [Spirochaetota bacterium]